MTITPRSLLHVLASAGLMTHSVAARSPRTTVRPVRPGAWRAPVDTVCAARPEMAPGGTPGCGV